MRIGTPPVRGVTAVWTFRLLSGWSTRPNRIDQLRITGVNSRQRRQEATVSMPSEYMSVSFLSAEVKGWLRIAARQGFQYGGQALQIDRIVEVLADQLAAGASHAPGQGWIVQQAGDRLGKGVGVAWRNQNAGD